jgi:acyl-CoA thioester hydrolase
MEAIQSTHHLSVRVYYEDTDFSGIVYHASYLRFFERGRTEYLRAHGISQADLFFGDGNQNFAFALRRIAVDYLKSARMDDELIIETEIVKLGGASIEMAQRVLRGAEILVTALAKVAVVSNGRACRLPASVAIKLKQTCDGNTS